MEEESGKGKHRCPEKIQRSLVHITEGYGIARFK